VREVLLPGKYYINPHAYDVTEQSAVEIHENEVGVRTLLWGKDPRELKVAGGNVYVVPDGYRGVQEKPISPGNYYVNPYVEKFVPIDTRGYRVEFMEQITILRGEDEVAAMEKTIANKGYYPVRLDQHEMIELQQHPQRVAELFTRCVLDRVTAWMEYAAHMLAGTGVQVYCCPGNNDPFEVDEVVNQARAVTLAGLTRLLQRWPS